MLSSISWSQYISAIILLFVCYYAYVGLKYFRWELLGLMGIKKVDTIKNPITAAEFKQQITTENPSDYLPKETSIDDFLSVKSLFKDEVTAYLLEAGGHTEIQEFLNSLRQICIKYSSLKNTSNRNTIDEFMLKAVKDYSGQEVSMNDIHQLWL